MPGLPLLGWACLLAATGRFAVQGGRGCIAAGVKGCIGAGVKGCIGTGDRASG